jgi:SAM-dependent methyltransferase
MQRSVGNDRCPPELEPSALVRRFASRIIGAVEGKPILDVACGSGRNAIFLSRLGCKVICIDKDLTILRRRELQQTMVNSIEKHQLELRQFDLVEDSWPFEEASAGGIVNVHFFLPSLFPFFENSLSPGGYLIFESVPGCGGNYLQLPPAGYVRSLLTTGFELEVYKERRVGPQGHDAVTTLTVAKRRRYAPLREPKHSTTKTQVIG